MNSVICMYNYSELISFIVAENYELKREVALSQLLQLIELPVVEGIVSETGRTIQKDGMAFSNLAFKQQDSILSANSLNRYTPCIPNSRDLRRQGKSLLNG